MTPLSIEYRTHLKASSVCYFVFALALNTLVSCKKDVKKDVKIDTPKVIVQIYDTVKPLDYFPAFPGSYWVYDNNDTMRVADRYEKYIFNSADFTAVEKYDTLVLPKLIPNGIFNYQDSVAFVKGYAISKGSHSNYRDPAFKEILALQQGDGFSIGGRIKGHQIVGETVVKDTIVQVGGITYTNVIVTIQYDLMCLSPGVREAEDCAYLREYYAKDVGLIKREERDTANTFVTKHELVKYMIKR